MKSSIYDTFTIQLSTISSDTMPMAMEAFLKEFYWFVGFVSDERKVVGTQRNSSNRFVSNCFLRYQRVEGLGYTFLY